MARGGDTGVVEILGTDADAEDGGDVELERVLGLVGVRGGDAERFEVGTERCVTGEGAGEEVTGIEIVAGLGVNGGFGVVDGFGADVCRSGSLTAGEETGGVYDVGRGRSCLGGSFGSATDGVLGLGAVEIDGVAESLSAGALLCLIIPGRAIAATAPAGRSLYSGTTS